MGARETITRTADPLRRRPLAEAVNHLGVKLSERLQFHPFPQLLQQATSTSNQSTFNSIQRLGESTRGCWKSAPAAGPAFTASRRTRWASR